MSVCEIRPKGTDQTREKGLSCKAEGHKREDAPNHHESCADVPDLPETALSKCLLWSPVRQEGQPSSLGSCGSPRAAWQR
jgi:hypothetical protein